MRRPCRRGVLGLLTVLLFASCRASGTDNGPAVANSARIKGDAGMKNVELRASAAVGPEELKVTYVVKNRGTIPIFVFDVAFGRGGVVRKDFPSVDYLDPEVVVLSSKLSAPPPGSAWSTPPRLYGSKVEPGEERKVERVQPLPVRTTPAPFALPPDPRNPPPAVEPQQVNCHTVRVILGFSEDSSELAAAAEPALGQATYSVSASAIDHQLLLATDVSKVSVPVLY